MMNEQSTVDQLWALMREQRALVQRLQDEIGQLRREQQAPVGRQRTSPSRLRGLRTSLVWVITLLSLSGWLLAPVGVGAAVSAPVNAWTPVAPMPTSRDYLAAATAPNGKIYLFGGFQTASGILATVEAYDPRSNSWTCSA